MTGRALIVQGDAENDPEYEEILAACVRDLAALGLSASVARDNWQQTYERLVERTREARLYAAAYAHLADKEQRGTP